MSDVTELRGEASATAAEASRRAALSALAAATAPEVDVPALVAETGRVVYAGGDADVVLLAETALTYFDAVADSRVYPTGYAGDHALVTVPACARLTGLGIALTAEEYTAQREALLAAVAEAAPAEETEDEADDDEDDDEQEPAGSSSVVDALAPLVEGGAPVVEAAVTEILAEGLLSDEELLESSAVDLKDYLAQHPGEADRVEVAENLRDDPRKTVLAAIAAARQA